MNFSLKGTRANKLIISKAKTEDDDKFGFGHAFSEEDDHSFLLVFDVVLDIGDGFFIEVNYLAEFEADEAIDQKEHRKILQINAPAIAYPFLRSYISTVLLNSGFEPILLPTVNFIEAAKFRSSKVGAECLIVEEN